MCDSLLALFNEELRVLSPDPELTSYTLLFMQDNGEKILKKNLKRVKIRTKATQQLKMILHIYTLQSTNLRVLLETNSIRQIKQIYTSRYVPFIQNQSTHTIY